MNYTDHFSQIAFSELRGIGPKRARILLDHLEEVNEIFTLPIREIHLRTGIPMTYLKKMNRDSALIKAEEIISDCEKLAIDPIFYTSPDYPRRLKQCEDAPLVVYRKGKLDYNTSKYVAIVGTRTPSEYGYGLCRSFIEGMKDSGAVIVSGLAYGIDVTIHKLCLEYELPTVGVLAHGLERIYPSHHKKTAVNMLDAGGGLLTEYAPNAIVERENFPMRNRIVAGMCDATIVVESKKKGGSLITAELANDYNREVFAFPGAVHAENSMGCNDLIAEQKAILLRDATDFLKKMEWKKKGGSVKQQMSLFHSLSDQERLLMQLLNRNQSMHIDSLVIESHFTISEINVLLFQLEMEGLVKNLPGNRYQLM